MKKLITSILLLSSVLTKAQSSDYAHKIESPIGYYIGVHALDDDDIPFTDPFNPQTINWAPYPSKIGVVYSVFEPLVLESSLSYIKIVRNPANKYLAPYNCFGFDINAQYHYCFYRKSEYDQFGVSSNKRAKLVSFYFAYGLSANLKNVLNEDLFLNMNLGGGMNWWIKPNHIAISAQTLAQVGLAGSEFRGNANQVRYSLGIIYKK